MTTWIKVLRAIFILEEVGVWPQILVIIKRYKYNGNLQIESAKVFYMLKEKILCSNKKIPKLLDLRWMHNQDPKAKPGSTFSCQCQCTEKQCCSIEL
jgi:hypothetical protein